MLHVHVFFIFLSLHVHVLCYITPSVFHEVGTVRIPILQMSPPGPRYIKYLIQGHTAVSSEASIHTQTLCLSIIPFYQFYWVLVV